MIKVAAISQEQIIKIIYGDKLTLPGRLYTEQETWLKIMKTIEIHQIHIKNLFVPSTLVCENGQIKMLSCDLLGQPEFKTNPVPGILVPRFGNLTHPDV